MTVPTALPARPKGGPRVVHEVPGRLRIRHPLLGLSALDTPQLQRGLRTIPGVSRVRINPDACSVVFAYDKAPETRRRILARMKGLDRSQLTFRKPDEDRGPPATPLVARLALLAALPLLPERLGYAATLGFLAPRILAGAKSLLHEGVTVELLDALAVSFGIWKGSPATALTTDFMMRAGEFLEETTMRHSGALLQEMLTPNPDKVWIEHETGAIEVPFSSIRKGARVVVGAGGLVPVDGIVRAGTAEVNQSSITGESLPVELAEGQRAIAGSVVESGRLVIEAEQVGDETTTARIAGMIRASLDARSDTERLAHKFADKQVYMTLGLAAATYAVTRDLGRLSSVFLVDYACPIKLSAPVAVRATMSEAVSRGILIKGGPSIEKLAEADTFVFDKTGTLTHGLLTVTDVVPLTPRRWSGKRLLALSASVEEHSQHPVARAIVSAAKAQGLDHIAHSDVHFDVGHGLRAATGRQEVLIGSRHFLEDLEGISFADHADKIEKLAGEGKMLLYVAVGGQATGLIGLRDELRDDAAETARRLRASGARHLVMLTGDRRARAEAFGEELGFDRVHADLRPEDKLRILKELKAAGHKVVFVGDGVNDAPALTEADIGISMSQGADIAQAAADIALMDDRIGAVADAREASAQAMRIIRQNNAVALAVNTGLFIAASTGFLSPVMAALLHNGTTISLLVSATARAGVSERDILQ